MSRISFLNAPLFLIGFRRHKYFHPDIIPVVYNKLMSRSQWSLLLANLFTIFVASLQRWTLADVMWVYWIQSVIIGVFQFLKILDLKNFSTEGVKINGESVNPTESTKKFMAYFFLLHYGIFHLTYFVFLAVGIDHTKITGLVITGLTFFFNHLISYLSNKESDANQIQNIGQVMAKPYIRIIPMHLSLFFANRFLPGGAPIFLTVKTVVDLISHSLEHRQIVLDTSVHS